MVRYLVKVLMQMLIKDQSVFERAIGNEFLKEVVSIIITHDVFNCI